MNSPWPLVPLSEVLSPLSRPERVDPEKSYNILGAHWYAEGLYIKDVLNGSEIRANQLYRVERGDFVYNRLFGWKGSFALATDENNGCYVSNEFPCFKVRSDRVDGRYLWRYFSLPSVWEEVFGLSTGGTPTSRNRLKEAQLLGMKISLPPLEEQRRILARIEGLCAKIEEARGLRRASIEQSSLLVTSLHLKLAARRNVKLREILALDEQEEMVEFGRTYPQVGVKGFGQGLFAKEALDATQTGYRSFNRLFEGAVVLSQVKGWEGAVAVCGEDLAGRYVSPEYRTFRCVSGKAVPQYLSALVSTPWFWTKLKDLTRGVGARRERTRPEQFLDLELPMPTEDQQRMAIPILQKIICVKQVQEETTEELDAFMPSILSRAFSGAL